MKKIHIILYTIYIFIDSYKIWTSILKNEVNFIQVQFMRKS